MMELILEIFVLASALSIDAFAVSLVYGMNHIKIPAVSVFILTSVSSLTLALSLLAGSFLLPFLPGALANDLSFLLLFSLGLFKLLKHPPENQAASADKNKDHLLSAKEAVPLGIALSLDSIAAGIGIGVFPLPIAGSILAPFLMTIAAILGGSLIGRKISRNKNHDFHWLCGLLLMALAFLRLF